MARIDSLRLLLAAEIPADLETVEALLREIVARIDTLEPGSDAHTLAHRRMNDLLTARDRLRPSLVDFLLARLAADEALVEGATGQFVGDAWAPFAWGSEIDVNLAWIAADREAKRRIVKIHEMTARDGCAACGPDTGLPVDAQLCETLRLLALPYADHPDYREEWRP